MSDEEAGPAPRLPLFLGSSGESQQEELPPTLDEFLEPGPETSTTPSISSVDLPQMEMAPPSPPIRRGTSLATPGPLLLPPIAIPDTPVLTRSRKHRLSFFHPWSSQFRSFSFLLLLLPLLLLLLLSFLSRTLKLLLPELLLPFLSLPLL